MKKRLCFIASLIVCLFGANAHAQLRKASDYFPLEAGNKWWTIGIKGLDYGLDSIQVTGATTINDTTYFIMESDSTEFFRKDAVGNVYKRIDGIDQLFYKVKVFSNKRGELPGQVHSDGRPFWFFTFHPAEWFQPFDTITVRISAELQDVFGEGLDGNGNWQYEGSPADDNDL